MVSISGIRGIVGESLTPETVVRYASAFAEYSGRGTIVIGRDGRASGKILGNIVSSTLLAMGCDVVAIGVCPTPTVELAVQRSGAAGGIAITASHNPGEWNGMKFIGSKGMFLDAMENERFWAIANQPQRYARWDKVGTHTANDSFLKQHADIVLGLPYIDIETIKKRKFKIVLDCINAAGGVIVPAMLQRLGCTVVEMNCDVSGIFSRKPEPIPENLGVLCQRVRDEKADVGIAVDPDVDRLVLITEKGEPFGEEYTIVSAVKFILEKLSTPQSALRTPHSVVVNLSTTRAVDDIARMFGAEVVRTPVGEINISKKMKEIGAVIGGEGSGGVILPAIHYGRDAIVGIALLLEQLAEFGGTASEFRASLPEYSIVKGIVPIEQQMADTIIAEIKKRHVQNGSANTDDGLKMDFGKSWVHIRKSNTEPILRILAEAPTMKEASEIVDKFRKEVENLSREK